MHTSDGRGSENFLLYLKCVIENKTASFYGSLYMGFGHFFHGACLCFL